MDAKPQDRNGVEELPVMTKRTVSWRAITSLHSHDLPDTEE